MNTDFKTRTPLTTSPPMGFRFWHAFARQLRQSVRYFGVVRALRELAAALWRAMLELLPSHRKARFGDLDFDWERSVNTTRSNVGFLTQLQAGLLGGAYYASDPWIFEQIMQELALSTQQSAVSTELSSADDENQQYEGLKDFTFIDLGAGKGRALLMASDYPFARVMGVEFMPDLCRAAQENIASYSASSNERQKCEQMEMVCQDACDFQFPAGPLVVYLFNPFSEPVFVKVLDNLRRSVEQAPREVYVAYRYTEHEKLLTSAMWLEKIAGTEQWAVYRNRRDRA
jgi:SAM-dependent methyltransferase